MMERRFKARLLVYLVCMVGMVDSGAAEAAQFTNPTDGYTLTYPDTWNVNLNTSARVVILRSFPPEQIPLSAFAPRPGATILIDAYPPYDNPSFPQGVDDYSALDKIAHGQTVISRTSPSSGKPARVTSVSDASNDRYVVTVVHRGGKVFRVVLECNIDDPQIPAYEQVLDDVIASITLTAATPDLPTPTPLQPSPTP